MAGRGSQLSASVGGWALPCVWNVLETVYPLKANDCNLFNRTVVINKVIHPCPVPGIVVVVVREAILSISSFRQNNKRLLE